MRAPVTVITGTRKGIGQYLAKYYVDLGHTVVGCSREPVTWEIAGYSHFSLDVADEAAVVAMFSSVRKQFGRIDHLINNAGIASMNHSALTPLATAERILKTNVLGTFLFCREGFKLMQKFKFGRIINFSTVAFPLKLEGEAMYAASKAAVESLTQVLAREFSEFGVTVNAVGPTPIDTDLIRGVPSQKLTQVTNRQAIKRIGVFSDVSNVIDFYLRPESSFITGQTTYLGGI